MIFEVLLFVLSGILLVLFFLFRHPKRRAEKKADNQSASWLFLILSIVLLIVGVGLVIAGR